MASFRWYPIHDYAVTIELDLPMGSLAQENIQQLRQLAVDQLGEHLIDLVPSYTSLTLCFHPKKSWTSFTQAIEQLLNVATTTTPTQVKKESVIKNIPVCYDVGFATDLENLSSRLKISIEHIIELHHQPIYQVYAVGFTPGFPYLGEINKQLVVPRKEIPSPRIQAGSVAIAHHQTGIYPFSTPGGWHVIGRTPLLLFDKNRSPVCFLETGDQVKFIPITKTEFENWHESSLS